MEQPLVTIVMPAYNAERFIAEAIESVLAQTYPNWELFVVDDGSMDRTAEVAKRYKDPRIRFLRKHNGGIGSARNLALEKAHGSFLCCLDSDDVLSPRSLETRLDVFSKDPGLDIVDGRVTFKDIKLQRTLRTYVPQAVQDPFHELVTFSARCFMGPSWMIRWSPDQTLRYTETISHAEDLFFCMCYSSGKRFGFTEEEILLYRRTGSSSMATNFEGMESSMIWIGRELRRRRMVTWAQGLEYEIRRRRMMAGTFWKAGRHLRAVLALFR